MDKRGWLSDELHRIAAEASARPELRARVAAHPSGFILPAAPRTCGNCAIADCEFAGLVPNCPQWRNTDDEIEREDIDRDLAPLSRSECARRGLRHSSEDDTRVIKATPTKLDLLGGWLALERHGLRSTAE